MIPQTIAEIEARVRQSGSLPESGRAELLSLLATLKTEVAELAKTDAEHADSIAKFTNVSAHEATRTDGKPELLKHSVSGLSATVAGFEESHPKLTEVVNRVATLLSNMGI